MAYHRRGWTIFPCRAKKPAIEWKWLRWQRLSEGAIRRWFGPWGRSQRDVDGIGVIHGRPSGGLAVRDFDDAAAYQQWAAAHPDLARTLPTAKTHRGFHVWFTAAVEVFHKGGDGELRGAPKQMTVLPPSKHPKGGRYRWINPPHPEQPPPTIGPTAAGLVPGCAKQAIVPRGTTPPAAQKPPSSSCYRVIVSSAGPAVGEGRGPALVPSADAAIARTLPRRAGERNRCLLRLVCQLKARFAGASAESLEGVVREWHERALPIIQTKEWEPTWTEFRAAWQTAAPSAGPSPAELVIADAACNPDEQLVEQLGEVAGKLASVCRALQELEGNAPFYIACRKAGEAIGKDHMTASRALRQLVQRGILVVVEEGGPHTMAASRYRFVEAALTVASETATAAAVHAA